MWVTAGFAVEVDLAVAVELAVAVDLAGEEVLLVVETELAADALAVDDAVAVDDALAVDAAEAGADTAGLVFTVLPECGVDADVAGVLGCGVVIDGKLEPGPLGVQADTTTATSSAPANVVRRTFMEPPRQRADNHTPSC